MAAAVQSKIDRICVFSTSPATGGLANQWVSHYWLMRDCFITTMQNYMDSPSGNHVLTLAYSAAFFAQFATPSGGALGARTASGYDWAAAKSWNGS
jgi:hypothetical protein